MCIEFCQFDNKVPITLFFLKFALLIINPATEISPRSFVKCVFGVVFLQCGFEKFFELLGRISSTGKSHQIKMLWQSLFLIQMKKSGKKFALCKITRRPKNDHYKRRRKLMHVSLLYPTAFCLKSDALSVAFRSFYLYSSMSSNKDKYAI